MLIGAHISSAGSFPKAAGKAARLGMNCAQHFTRNPRGGRQRSVDAREVEAFIRAREELGIRVVVMHTPYTVNLASSRPEVVAFARRAIREDVQRCHLLEIPYLVLHPGSHVGDGIPRGTERIVEGLRGIIDEARPALEGGVRILLEMMAGSGSEIGSTPGELATILEGIDGSPYVGLCLDTCHSFARGYALGDEKGLESYLGEIQEVLGLDRVCVVHLNDSKGLRGGRRDRHARMGRGNIGRQGLTRIVNHPALRHLPFVLEVPVDEEEEYGEEVALVKSWRVD